MSKHSTKRIMEDFSLMMAQIPEGLDEERRNVLLNQHLMVTCMNLLVELSADMTEMREDLSGLQAKLMHAIDNGTAQVWQAAAEEAASE